VKEILLGIAAFLIAAGCAAQTRLIHGRVADAVSGEPLASASVRAVDAGSGVTARQDGKFSFAVPYTSAPALLIISYAGYEPDTLDIRTDQSSYLVLLSPVTGALRNVVVTTGAARAIPLRENPVPIMVISAKTIDGSIGDNIIDALALNAPGFNSVKTGPGVSKPFIHGLGYNRVLTLYDGVRQESQQWGDEHGIVVDDYNIERVEIIKGPASLLYGSDAVAGVLSLFPVMPFNTSGKITGRYTSEFQGNNGLIGNGVRLIYGKDHWSYSLRGSYRLAKNYRNPVDGWVYNTNFRTTNISFTTQYKAKMGYSTMNLNLYDHKQGIPDGTRDSLSRQFTRQVYEIYGQPADNIKNRPVVPYASLNTYRLSPLHQRIQDYKFYSNNHYTFGGGYLDGQIAFTQNLRREYDHPTDPGQAGMYIRLNTLNYGVRYTIRLLQILETTIGVNGMYQNNKSQDATDFPIPDFNLVDAGPYLYLHRKMGPWAVSGGVRYDTRFIQGNNFYTRQDPSTGFFKRVGTDTAGANLQFPAFRKTFGGLSFSLGLTYQINDHISLKANMARGFRAPNISEFASKGLDPGAHIVYLGNRNASPEFSLQEDAGIQITYANLSASLTLFNNNIEHYIYEAQEVDAQGNPVIVVPGNKTFRYEQASAQLFGLEATLTLRPEFLKGLSFDNAFSLINGYNRSPAYRKQGIHGEYLPFMPPVRVLSGLSQELKPRSSVLTSMAIKVQADLNATQNHYLALDQTETATPGYVLLNAGLLVSIKYTKTAAIQVQIQVNNLLNTDYQSNQSRLKYFEYYLASPNGRLGMFGMGRNICAKLIMPF